MTAPKLWEQFFLEIKAGSNQQVVFPRLFHEF